MRLIAEHDENRVVAIDDVEQFLEVGSRMVRVEHVPHVLAAIRTSARSLLPSEPVDPVRLEEIASRLRGLAGNAAALAGKVPPDDPDALAIKAALVELGLTPSP